MASPDPTETTNRAGSMLPPNTNPTDTRDHRGSSLTETSRGLDAEAPTCRICYRGTVSADEEHGPLVSPCSCRGLIGFAHERCLEKWLREKDTNHCDVCLQRFSVHRKPVPLWYFFRDPKHRNDVLRMVVNALSCIGDIMMLSFAWTYASGFLGSVGWLTYLFILCVLLFQTIFWMMVEIIRIMACYEPVRKWRDKTCSVDAVLKGRDSTDPAPSARGPEVVVLQEKNLAPNEGGPGSGTHSPMQSREKDRGQVRATPECTMINWKSATPTQGQMSAERTTDATGGQRPKHTLRIPQ